MAAKWFSQDPRTKEWTSYDASDTAALEKSFQTTKAPVKLDFCGTAFTVDVKKMVQTNSSGGSRPVRRDAVAAPSQAVVNFCNGMTEDGVMDTSKFEDFFSALGIDAATAQPFVLFYKFGAEGCWQLTKQEMEFGFAQYSLEPNPTSVGAALKGWLSTLATDFNEFSKFYEFVFKFSRPNSSAKAIAFEDLKEPMSVVLAVHRHYTFGSPQPLLDFYSTKVRAMSFDLWKQTLRFLHEVKPGAPNYSEDDCWNSALDDFVEKVKSGK